MSDVSVLILICRNPEAFSSQKCHMNMGSIINRYGDSDHRCHRTLIH